MTSIVNNPILLASEMIKFHTVTPKDDGILDYLAKILAPFNVKSEIKFFGENEKKTGNIYLKFGNSGRNFCFAGHVDVVPVGDINKWSENPFGGEIKNGKLYGRGAVDMKGGVAAFVSAMCKFLSENPSFSESISILLTCDEEASGEFGLKEMIKYLDGNGEKFTSCIIGEPTCEECIGDTIRLGRRGSINFQIEFIGLQGHVAYKELIKNPITALGNAIYLLKSHKFDEGNEFYEASNLEFVDVSTDNFEKATNVVPSRAKCMFNIRYNNYHTGEKLAEFIKNTLNEIAGKDGYEMKYRISNDSFLYGNTEISKIVTSVINEQKFPDFQSVKGNCGGGTTDGRYIIQYCKDVVELGLRSNMAHKIDEFAGTEEIERLTDIYYKVLISYFK